jgi:hypothetical protein
MTVKCLGFFSLFRNPEDIGHLIRSTSNASIRLFYINPQVALNVDETEMALCPVFLGSEEKHGNNREVFT